MQVDVLVLALLVALGKSSQLLGSRSVVDETATVTEGLGRFCRIRAPVHAGALPFCVHF
jgi:hypothetical protein